MCHIPIVTNDCKPPYNMAAYRLALVLTYILGTGQIHHVLRQQMSHATQQPLPIFRIVHRHEFPDNLIASTILLPSVRQNPCLFYLVVSFSYSIIFRIPTSSGVVGVHPVNSFKSETSARLFSMGCPNLSACSTLISGMCSLIIAMTSARLLPLPVPRFTAVVGKSTSASFINPSATSSAKI